MQAAEAGVLRTVKARRPAWMGDTTSQIAVRRLASFLFGKNTFSAPWIHFSFSFSFSFSFFFLSLQRTHSKDVIIVGDREVFLSLSPLLHGPRADLFTAPSWSCLECCPWWQVA